MMGDKSSIEWCDATWNPITGCTKVSPGCAHCYAEKLFPRPYPGRPFSDVRFHPERVTQPSRWRKPRRVFVNSMSDLFHEALTDDQILDVWRAMCDAPRHVFQVLTKRPERMLAFLRDGPGWSYFSRALPNVWLGVSVEDQRRADERIPILLDTPAAGRFVSAEPLLGPVDLTAWLPWDCTAPECPCDVEAECSERGRLNWVICGGESGPKARPCDIGWVLRIVADCQAAGVPVFVKQLGHRPVVGEAPACTWITDRKGGKPDEWPADLRVREWPEAMRIPQVRERA